MTEQTTGPVATEIAARLTHALTPSHLEVINDSHHHAGHMGDDGSGESHFTVIVESAAFAGKSRVERQRLVNRALSQMLVSRVHALSMKLYAEGERG